MLCRPSPFVAVVLVLVVLVVLGVVRVAVPVVAGAGGGEGEADDLVDDGDVGVAGDDRDRQRVARGGLGVRAGQVAGLAEAGVQPCPLKLARAGHVPQLRQRDVHDHLGIGPGPVRDQPGPDQQLAGMLQCVVEPLLPGPAVLGAVLLAERLKDRGDRGGALGGQVAPDHSRPAERGAHLHVPVIEPVIRPARPARGVRGVGAGGVRVALAARGVGGGVVGAVGVGLPGPPRLDRRAGDRRQVLE